MQVDKRCRGREMEENVACLWGGRKKTDVGTENFTIGGGWMQENVGGVCIDGKGRAGCRCRALKSNRAT